VSDAALADQAHAEPLREGSPAVLKSQLQDALGKQRRQTAPADVLHPAEVHRGGGRGGGRGGDGLRLALCHGRIDISGRTSHKACMSGQSC